MEQDESTGSAGPRPNAQNLAAKDRQQVASTLANASEHITSHATEDDLLAPAAAVASIQRAGRRHPRGVAGRLSGGYVRSMSTNADRIRQLFVDIDRLDFVAVASHCTHDCVYEDVPLEMATAIGPAAIRAKLEIGLSSLERLPTTVHELVEAGDTVMVERTEVWHHKTGERATLRVAAVFKFRDGKISVWRDYWDAQTLFSQQPPTWLAEIPRP